MSTNLERTTILVHWTDEPTKRAYQAIGDYESRELARAALPALVTDIVQDDEDPISPEDLDDLVEEVLDHAYLEGFGVGFLMIPFSP